MRWLIYPYSLIKIVPAIFYKQSNNSIKKQILKSIFKINKLFNKILKKVKYNQIFLFKMIMNPTSTLTILK
jgi:hypothetical protein